MTQSWQHHVDTGIYPPRTHLFPDDFHIRHMKGVRRMTSRPEHVGEGPVLAPQRPWEGIGLIGRNCIIHDAQENLLKCWYPCHDPALPDTPVKSKRRWGYATGADGVAWDRPNLGLVEFEGSTANNLIAFENLGEVVGLLWNVVKDESDPDPSKRYKAIGMDRHAVRDGEITWTGPDGEDDGKNAGHIWGDPTYDGQRVTTSGFGLARLPRDRWVAVTNEPGVAEGELLTGLVCLASNEVHLNVDASAGSVAVAIDDCQTGRAVPGLALEDCDTISVDSLDHTVTWQGRSDLSDIIGTARRQPSVGRGLMLRFALCGARLYGFSC